ncbi:MAG: amino acid racemase [Desulfobacterales bacterium]|nr:amino acid racemase [Desulfobacterales bacterium]
MSEKTIGILGGMGPEATLECFAQIIKSTPASTDQQHLRVVIDSNPKVPDRTAAITGKGPSPVPALVDGCRALQAAGADFIIMPCVSAHFYLAEIRQHIKLPVLSIYDAVADAISSDHPDIKTVGLLGTTGTISGGLFQKRLAADNCKTIVPDDLQQAKVMAAIYDIKNSVTPRSRQHISSDLAAVAVSLVSGGAQAIIAGCTEIPLALKQEHVPVIYFDVLTILARAAIVEAGMRPLAMP